MEGARENLEFKGDKGGGKIRLECVFSLVHLGVRGEAEGLTPGLGTGGRELEKGEQAGPGQVERYRGRVERTGSCLGTDNLRVVPGRKVR